MTLLPLHVKCVSLQCVCSLHRRDGVCSDALMHCCLLLLQHTELIEVGLCQSRWCAERIPPPSFSWQGFAPLKHPLLVQLHSGGFFFPIGTGGHCHCCISAFVAFPASPTLQHKRVSVGVERKPTTFLPTSMLVNLDWQQPVFARMCCCVGLS